jgi:urea transport system permease protein
LKDRKGALTCAFSIFCSTYFLRAVIRTALKKYVAVFVQVFAGDIMLENILDGLFNGLGIGSILVLTALGLSIVFGLMGVINMAHGELMMLGAYTAFLVQNAFKGLGKIGSDIYIFPALILAFIVVALVGLALERFVVRHLYGRSLETLLATWGVSLVLQQFVRSVSWQMIVGFGLFGLIYAGCRLVLKQRSQLLSQFNTPILIGSILLAWLSGDRLAWAIGKFWGSAKKLTLTQPWFDTRNIDVTPPSWLQEGLKVGTTQLPYARMFIMGLTVLCVLGLLFFLQRTPWGLRIRAVTQNREMSACLGIPTRKVDALTFAIGSGLAGIAGVAVTLLGSVGPNTGQNYIVNMFMVVVLGGVGKLSGTIVAGLGFGILSYLVESKSLLPLASLPGLQPIAQFFEFFGDSSMSKVLIFSIIVLFLQFKPAGIFAPKGRMAEI